MKVLNVSRRAFLGTVAVSGWCSRSAYRACASAGKEAKNTGADSMSERLGGQSARLPVAIAEDGTVTITWATARKWAKACAPACRWWLRRASKPTGHRVSGQASAWGPGRFGNPGHPTARAAMRHSSSRCAAAAPPAGPC